VKRSSRQRWRPPILASVALTLVFVVLPSGVYAWGSHSSSFAVKQVEVKGAQRISTQRALELLEAAYLGHNLFTVRAADVSRTLRSLVYLDSVRIDRDFPSRLIVTVTEHTPGLYALRDHHWYLVSLGGQVLTIVGPEKRKDGAALLGGPAGVAMKLATVAAAGPLPWRGPATDAAVRDALAVARALPAAARHDLATVARTDAGLRLLFRSGLVVDVGETDHLRAKALSLQAVLGYYRAHHRSATYVDVSVPDRPVARPHL
jgi:cell division septal protein FtsQ